MTTEDDLLKSNALRELKRLAKERGFEFILHPAGDLIPGFLGGMSLMPSSNDRTVAAS
jgi:hypothetical protein